MKKKEVKRIEIILDANSNCDVTAQNISRIEAIGMLSLVLKAFNEEAIKEINQPSPAGSGDDML